MVISSVLDRCRHTDYSFGFSFRLYLPYFCVLEHTETEFGWRIYRSSDIFWVTTFRVLYSSNPTLKVSSLRIEPNKHSPNNKPRHATPISRPVYMLSRRFNPNPVIEARPR